MQLITENAQALSRRLGVKAQALEAILGYWVKRYPYQEREEGTQEMALQLLKAKADRPKFAFGICKRVTAYWWRQYMVRQHYSLDLVLDNEDGRYQSLLEEVLGVCQYDILTEVMGKLDGANLYRSLPREIKLVVAKRLKGKRLADAERQRLSRWLRKDGTRELLGMAQS